MTPLSRPYTVGLQALSLMSFSPKMLGSLPSSLRRGLRTSCPWPQPRWPGDPVPRWPPPHFSWRSREEHWQVLAVSSLVFTFNWQVGGEAPSLLGPGAEAQASSCLSVTWFLPGDPRPCPLPAPGAVLHGTPRLGPSVLGCAPSVHLWTCG